MIAQVYSDDNIEVYRFLSTDEKPLSCKHGSRALEIDTGRKYIFDAENSIWQEVHDSDEDRPVDAYTKEETQALLLTKVDKVSGMGLSQESYTTAEKQKLAGIEAGATAVTVDSALSSTSTNPVQNQAVYADKQKQDAALAEVENKGAKNRLPLTGESTDIFTINADGTMTANGSSSTSKRDFAYYIGAPPKGIFVFSGCPPTGSNTTYRMFLQSVVGSTYTTLATLTGDPVEVDLTNIDKIRVLMSIYAGYTPNNIKFSPMLCTKAEWDVSQAYVPYGKTNHELTVENVSQQSEINYVANAGAKNFFDIEATPTVYHTDFTLVSGKLTVTANGNWGHYSVPLSLPAGSYILSTVISGYNKASGAPDTSMRLRMSETTSSVTSIVLQTVTGNGSMSVPFTWTGGTLYLQFYPNYNGTAYANGFAAENTMIRPAAITDSTFVPYGKTNAELTAENTSQQAEINYAVNTGVKNLFDINTSLPLKIHNTTYTLSDGSLTVTSNGSWGHHSVPVNLPAGNYIFTATISNFSKDSSASVTSVRMKVTDTTATGGIEIASKAVTGNGAFELPFTWTGGQCYIQYYPNYTSTTTYVSSFTASNNMIRPAKITDPTYEPYALPNPTLTPAAIKAVDEGAKNICNWSADTSTIENVTFTINPDKTVSASGTATARSQKALTFTVPSTLKAGRYVLSGCPTGGAQSGTVLYCLYIWDNTANARVCSNDTGNGIEFDWTPDASHTYSLAVDVRSGTNASGLIFKPMICTAADWNMSKKFVPYAPTNRELYEEKIGIEDVFGVRPQIADNTDLNTLQTIGKYVCGGLAKAQTLLNCPMQGAFIMLVDAVGALTRLIQRIYGFDTNTGKVLIYIRALTINGWGSWYKFEGTEVT